MAPKISRRGAVPPFIVMDVLRAANERIAAGADVVHLELGQPATGAPKGVIETAKRMLDTDPLGYTDALGIPILRERIAGHYRTAYGMTVAPDRIVVTFGASGAFILSFLAAFDPGDRVALADPSYPAYRNILMALGVEPVLLPAGPDSRFQPTVAHLEAAGDIAGLIVASPSNPAGTMLHPDELAALAAWCRGRGVRLISDEIYHGITFGGRAETALRYDDTAIVINSFSKYFSMTGWRVGWMVVPPDLDRSVECLTQNLYISVPTLSQHAAAAAFECIDELEANVAHYAANRARMLDALPKAGFDRLAPVEGAFYVYADVSHLTNDSEAFCKAMLADAGVASAPGIDFDTARGRRYVRFSFAGSEDQVAEGIRRLAAWRR